MATRLEIEFNYQKAMAQVRELRSLSTSLKKVGDNQIADCMRDVSKNWKCDNSTDYVAKGNKLKQKVVKSAGKISDVADALSTMAENIKNAELKSLDIVKTDSYKG